MNLKEEKRLRLNLVLLSRELAHIWVLNTQNILGRYITAQNIWSKI